MGSSPKAYPKTDQSTSTNRSVLLYDLRPLVADSDLPFNIRILLLAYLNAAKSAKYGQNLWAAVDTLCVSIGKVRRGTERVSRRSVFGWIKIARDLGILELKERSNSWVQFEGKREYRHSATYRINPEKLNPRMTVAQYKAQRDAGRKSHAAEHWQPDQSAKKQVQHAGQTPLSRVQVKYLYSEVPKLMKGCTRIIDKGSGTPVVLSPADKRYRAPLDKQTAIRRACESAPPGLKPISFQSAIAEFESFRLKGDAHDDSD